MLHHISLAAQNPEQVSSVLAELIGGHSYPFPVHPGSFIALADDDYGTAIEVYPSRSMCIPGQGDEQVIFQSLHSAPAYSSTHIALSVPHDEETIINIGKREGWRTLPCSRGPFELIELWVENSFMVEFLTESMLPRYLETMRAQTWKTLLCELSSLAALHQE